uniref:LETM1 domain-containing protein n=1 Tax=Heterorhabditis bacteriophora TaxID=37862 RepID=A0A1I7X7Y9_HETBA
MMVVMILLPLPLTIYLIGFAIIFFPRLVLTRHFWSDNQRKKFFLYDVTKSMTKGTVLRRIIGNPSSVNCIHLPKIEELPTSLVHVLSSIHSFYYLPGISRRLSKRCEAMRELDKRLYAEIDCLTSRQLYFYFTLKIYFQHMYIRRIDYTKQSEQEMRDILRKWLKFTSNLENSAYLCAPVFFNGRKS